MDINIRMAFEVVLILMLLETFSIGEGTDTEVYELWDSQVPFPKLDEIPEIPAVEHIRIHTAEPDYSFLLGAAIIEHKGALFVGWGNSVRDENDEGSIMAGRRSLDGGKSWGDLEIIAPNPEGPDAHSHGVFLSHGGTLWAFVPRAEYGDIEDYPNLRTEAFLLDEETNQWSSEGIVVNNRFWPMQEPQRMEDGNFLMAGMVSHRWPNADAAVAISHGEDLTQWDLIFLPSPAGMRSWGETTVLGDGEEILAIIRNQSEPIALVSSSRDFGRTWSKIRKSNFPMAPSKPYAGILSTGQRYFISNTPGGEYRDTLTIAITVPHEGKFRAIWKIRSGLSPEPRFPGKGHRRQWAYPYASEHDGKLYVVYASSKENCELSIIPIESLEPG